MLFTTNLKVYKLSDLGLPSELLGRSEPYSYRGRDFYKKKMKNKNSKRARHRTVRALKRSTLV